MKITYCDYNSPIGLLHIVMDDIGVKRIFILREHWEEFQRKSDGILKDSKTYSAVIRELDEYFSGKRHSFSIPLSVDGTEFYKQVWQALISIPYGEVRSYSDIACTVGRPRARRAIGQANRNNPLPILIPCHRVVGKSGALTGYLGKNLDIKTQLLQMEHDFKNNSNSQLD